MKERIIRVTLSAAGICTILIGIFVLLLTFSEYQPKPEEAIEIREGTGAFRTIYEGDRIELLTWNIGYAGLDESMDSVLSGGTGEAVISKERIAANMEAIIERIEAQEYDVLFVQEVDRSAKRSYKIDEEGLLVQSLDGNSMFAQNYRCLFVPYPIKNPIGSINSGILTMTTLQASSSARMALNNEHEWPARVWNRKYCALITRIPVTDSGRELVLVNVQLAAYSNEEEQKRQMTLLVDFLEQEYLQGNYVIAGGDFNQAFPDDNFSTYPIRRSEYFEPDRMTYTFKDINWTFASDRSAPTCRLPDESYSRRKWWTQLYVIDGYILSPNVALEEVTTINDHFKYSYHNPVKLTVVLEETPVRMQTPDKEAEM